MCDHTEPDNIFKSIKYLKETIAELKNISDLQLVRIQYLEEQMELQTDLNEKLVLQGLKNRN